MENLANKQKIEIQLIESQNASTVSFSKRKKHCFSMHIRLQLGLMNMLKITPVNMLRGDRILNEYKLATRARGNVGFIVFSLSVKPFFYGSTSKEKIVENFSKVKVEDFQHDYT
ncbi:hypothetical protein H5410_030327 [Solanum commersonii]|uniref:Uncharacterized protein n=1 Tax=Solanum commersonii TaxID=4109 RepID=A0A9J5YFV5_SOLCO|nr:hypothetical protein H5410_030327 [Solanum commersonii]